MNDTKKKHELWNKIRTYFALKKTTEAKSEKEKYKKCVETAKA